MSREQQWSPNIPCNYNYACHFIFNGTHTNVWTYPKTSRFQLHFFQDWIFVIIKLLLCNVQVRQQTALQWRQQVTCPAGVLYTWRRHRLMTRALPRLRTGKNASSNAWKKRILWKWNRSLFLFWEQVNIANIAFTHVRVGTRGGAANFKVGVQNRIRERSEQPPLFQMWGYKQANISSGLLNILKFAVWLSH